MSRERPILFSSPMVRAILAGQKTQTRRVCKLEMREGIPEPEYQSLLRCCPYGHPGDRLWVRETWRIGAWDCDTGGIAIDYRADKLARREWLSIPDDFDGEVFNRYWQQSCDDCEAAGLEMTKDGGWKWEPGQSPCRWRPSIHMPRWASRILLDVVSVRVERLQDISEADAIAEGANHSGECDHVRRSCAEIGCLGPNSYRAGYTQLWEQINGPGSWSANPWVWVVSFKPVTP